MELMEMEVILQQILSEIKDFKVETNARLDKVDARLDKVDARLDKVDAHLDAIEGRQAAFSKDIAHHNHVVEPKLKIILENIDGITARNRQVDRLEDKVEGHGHRIWALEQLAVTK